MSPPPESRMLDYVIKLDSSVKGSLMSELPNVTWVKPSQICALPHRNTGRRDLSLAEIAAYYPGLFRESSYNPMNEKGKETIKTTYFKGWDISRCAGLIAHLFKGSVLPPEITIARAIEERERMVETIANMGDKTGALSVYRSLFFEGVKPLSPEYFLDTGSSRFRAIPWILAGCTPQQVADFRIPIFVTPYVGEDESFDATLGENVTTEKKEYSKSGQIAIAVRLLRRGLGETAIARKLGIPLKRRTYIQEVVSAGRVCITQEESLHLLDRLFLEEMKIKDADGKEHTVYQPGGFIPATALRRGELLTLMGGPSAVKKDGTPHSNGAGGTCAKLLQPDKAAAPPEVWEQLFEECCTGRTRTPHQTRETILAWGKLFVNKKELVAPIYQLLATLCEDPTTKEGQAYLAGLTMQLPSDKSPLVRGKGSKPK